MKTNNPQPQISLVLSGGAGRGNAHIGILKVLEREQIPIDSLVGVSMGGIIGAGYAAGMSPQEMEAEAIRMSHWPRLLELVDRKLPQKGLVTGKRIHDYMVKQVGATTTFDDLRVPLSLVAVDLNSGREVVLRQGRVVDAVRATVAIPGLIAPMEMNGCRLVDGGLLNNVPVDVARQMGSDIVIAVDVMGGFNTALPSWLGQITNDACRALSIVFKQLYDSKMEQAPPDVLINLNGRLSVSALTGYTRAAETIAAGEAAAEATLPQIQQVIANNAQELQRGAPCLARSTGSFNGQDTRNASPANHHAAR